MKQKTKAMFGISVFKQSITKDIISKISAHLSANYDDCVIVLVDEPEKHNWVLRGRNSPEHALQVARGISFQHQNTIQRLLRHYKLSNISVATWSWVDNQAIYKKNIHVIAKYFAEHADFRLAVHEQLKSYLGGYLKTLESTRSRAVTTEELDEMALFYIEELAGLAYLHFKRGYSTDVYPGPQGKVTKELFTGLRYTDLGKALYVDPTIYTYVEFDPLNNVFRSDPTVLPTIKKVLHPCC